MNILITGAGSGIGRALALRLGTVAADSCELAITGRNKTKLTETSAMLHRPPLIIPADLTCANQQDILESNIRLRFDGSLDLLILAAGVHSRMPVGTDPWLQSLSKNLGILNTNLTANVSLIERMYPFLKAAHGMVIHINSVAAKNMCPDEAAYSASKHGMSGYLKALRYEARQHGVRVLDVILGAVNTPLYTGTVDSGKLMDANDVASAITHVISPFATLQIEELQLGRTIV